MLYDTMIGGQNRKVVSHFGRNGFFYSLWIARTESSSRARSTSTI